MSDDFFLSVKIDNFSFVFITICRIVFSPFLLQVNDSMNSQKGLESGHISPGDPKKEK